MKDRIKQIREHFGLTQAQLAQRINRTCGLIALIETGRCNVSEDAIKRICSAFPVNESWLRTGEGKMTSAAPVDTENVKERIKKIRNDRGLSMQKFGSVIGYSKQLISLVERGESNPSDDFISNISYAFGISQEWLLTGVGEMCGKQEGELDNELISWLKLHPEVIRELKQRSGRS